MHPIQGLDQRNTPDRSIPLESEPTCAISLIHPQHLSPTDLRNLLGLNLCSIDISYLSEINTVHTRTPTFLPVELRPVPLHAVSGTTTPCKSQLGGRPVGRRTY